MIGTQLISYNFFYIFLFLFGRTHWLPFFLLHFLLLLKCHCVDCQYNFFQHVAFTCIWAHRDTSSWSYSSTVRTLRIHISHHIQAIQASVPKFVTFYIILMSFESELMISAACFTFVFVVFDWYYTKKLKLCRTKLFWYVCIYMCKYIYIYMRSAYE